MAKAKSPEQKVSARDQRQLNKYLGELATAEKVVKLAQEQKLEAALALNDYLESAQNSIVLLKGAAVTIDFASGEMHYAKPWPVAPAPYRIGEVQEYCPPGQKRADSITIVRLHPLEDENIVSYGVPISKIEPATAADVRAVSR